MTATTAATQAARKHISYSQINQIRTCGEQYRLERVEKKPQRPSVPAVAGRVIHVATETVDHHLNDPLAVSIETTRAAAHLAAEKSLAEEVEASSVHYPPDQWRKYGRPTSAKPNAEDIGWFAEVGIPTSIDSYIDWRVANPNLHLLDIPGFGPAIEVPFELTLPSGEVVKGYIDRIFVDDNGVALIVDIKSGAKPKTTEQLGTYARALTAGLPGVEFRWGAYVYGLKTGVAKMTGPHDLHALTDDRLSRIYDGAAFAIRNNLFIPHPGESCFHCAVSEHCEFVQLAL